MRTTHLLASTFLFAAACAAHSTTAAPAQPDAPKAQVAESDDGSDDAAAGPTWPDVTSAQMAERLTDQKQKNWRPSDQELTSMQQMGLTEAHVYPRFCVDTSGKVTWAAAAKPSEYPPLDSELLSVVKSWSFKPGSAACSTFTLDYHLK